MISYFNRREPKDKKDEYRGRDATNVGQSINQRLVCCCFYFRLFLGSVKVADFPIRFSMPFDDFIKVFFSKTIKRS